LFALCRWVCSANDPFTFQEPSVPRAELVSRVGGENFRHACIEADALSGGLLPRQPHIVGHMDHRRTPQRIPDDANAAVNRTPTSQGDDQPFAFGQEETAT
jgi:hypothetical protein